MSAMLLSWLTGAVLLFWAIGAYNRLVRLRSQAAQGFGILDERLRQLIVFAKVPVHGRDAGVTAGDAAASDAPQAAAAGLELALRQARTHPFDVAGMRGLTTAYAALVCTWPQARDPGEDVLVQPYLAEGPGRQWRDLVLQVEAARTDFNQRIEQYNAAVRQFPAVLLAQMLGLKAAQVI